MIFELIKSFILGIVQGITEWLPVSSTGHMLLVDEFLKLDFPKDFTDMFFVVIQFSTFSQSTAPCKDRCHRVGGCFFPFQVFVVVTLYGSVCSFVFVVAVRRYQY